MSECDSDESQPESDEDPPHLGPDAMINDWARYAIAVHKTKEQRKGAVKQGNDQRLHGSTPSLVLSSIAVSSEG